MIDISSIIEKCTRLPAVKGAFDGIMYDRYLTPIDTIIMCEEGTLTVHAIMTVKFYENLYRMGDKK